MKMTLAEAETCIKERDNIIVFVSTVTHIFNPFILRTVLFQSGVIQAAVLWLSKSMLWLHTVLVLFLSRGWKQWWFWFNPNCQFASRWRCICFLLSWLHRAHDNCFVALRDWEPEIKQQFFWRYSIFICTHVRLAVVKLNLNPREKDLKKKKEHEKIRNRSKNRHKSADECVQNSI